MTPSEIVAYLVFWLLMGVISAVIAWQKGRSPIVWLVVGTLTSVIGLAVIVLLPRVASRQSAELSGSASPSAEPGKPYPAEDDNPMDGKFGEYLPLAIAAMAIVGAVIYTFSG